MIYFRNEEIKNKFMNNFNGDLNIKSLIENAEKNKESIGYLDSSNSELKIAINNDYAYIDEMGELEQATGIFKKYLDLNSSVTELEQKLCEFIDIILNNGLDIICLGKIEL